MSQRVSRRRFLSWLFGGSALVVAAFYAPYEALVSRVRSSGSRAMKRPKTSVTGAADGGEIGRVRAEPGFSRIARPVNVHAVQTDGTVPAPPLKLFDEDELYQPHDWAG